MRGAAFPSTMAAATCREYRGGTMRKKNEIEKKDEREEDVDGKG